MEDNNKKSINIQFSNNEKIEEMRRESNERVARVISNLESTSVWKHLVRFRKLIENKTLEELKSVNESSQLIIQHAQELARYEQQDSAPKCGWLEYYRVRLMNDVYSELNHKEYKSIEKPVLERTSEKDIQLLGNNNWMCMKYYVESQTYFSPFVAMYKNQRHLLEKVDTTDDYSECFILRYKDEIPKDNEFVSTIIKSICVIPKNLYHLFPITVELSYN
jgi:hypothetical protein